MKQAIPAIALLLAPALADDAVPPGWKFASSAKGAYAAGTESLPDTPGSKLAYLRAVSAEDPKRSGSGLARQVAADSYRGHRLRVSTRLRTEKADQARCSLSLAEGAFTLVYANVPVANGSHDWADCSVVLDVPQQATSLWVGFNLGGGGTVWSDGFRFEIVGRDVPLSEGRMPPDRPVNTSFDP